ncbi:GTP-binding protein Rheb isoform 4-T4 [Cariama cristata]
MPPSKSRKIAILGYRSVGKSSLTIQFVEGQFVDSYDPTIENTFTKLITVNGQEYHLQLVDTAGQDEYSIFPQTYSIDINGYILVYSVTSIKRIPIMLVGNKKDLHMERVISYEEGKALAESWNAAFLESSAKENQLLDCSIWTRQPCVGSQPRAEERGLKLDFAEEVLAALEAMVKTSSFPFSSFFEQRSFYVQTSTLKVIKDNFCSYPCFWHTSLSTKANASRAESWRSAAAAAASRTEVSSTGSTPSASRAGLGSASITPTSEGSSTSWSTASTPISIAGTAAATTWAPAGPSGCTASITGSKYLRGAILVVPAWS